MRQGCDYLEGNARLFDQRYRWDPRPQRQSFNEVPTTAAGCSKHSMGLPTQALATAETQIISQ